MRKILTHSGRALNPAELYPEDISLVDIAHSLSLQCRFNGHTPKHYSVAQHCVFVSYLCDPKDALWGLLHDAHEAYVSDIVRPLKEELGNNYARIEEAAQRAICITYGLDTTIPKSVKEADDKMLDLELSAFFFDACELHPMPAEQAKTAFINRFHDLSIVEHDPAEEAAIRTKLLQAYYKTIQRGGENGSVRDNR